MYWFSMIRTINIDLSKKAQKVHWFVLFSIRPCKSRRRSHGSSSSIPTDAFPSLSTMSATIMSSLRPRPSCCTLRNTTTRIFTFGLILQKTPILTVTCCNGYFSQYVVHRLVTTDVNILSLTAWSRWPCDCAAWVTVFAIILLMLIERESSCTLHSLCSWRYPLRQEE